MPPKKNADTSEYMALHKGRHDGEKYGKGAVLNLTDDQAAPLVREKLVQKIERPAAPAAPAAPASSAPAASAS